MADETTTPDTTEETAPAVPKLIAGFAVLISDDGNVFIEKDPKVFTVPVEREASLLEIRRYSSEILMDLNAQAAGEYAALKINTASTPNS